MSFLKKCLCGADPDEVFAYPTPKIVVMKDATLGLMRICFMVFIVVYIFIFSILFRGTHLKMTDIEGVFRITVRHPTKAMCDPFNIGCEANYTPLVQLPYCTESSLDYKVYDKHGQLTEGTKRRCQYWDYIEASIPTDSGLFVPMRVRRYEQHRNCIPNKENGYSCVKNEMWVYKDFTFGEDYQLIPGEHDFQSVDGPGEREATPIYDAFVADVESFTVLLDHGFRDGTGRAFNDYNMSGIWLLCKSPDEPDSACVRHVIPCGHESCDQVEGLHEETPKLSDEEERVKQVKSLNKEPQMLLSQANRSRRRKFRQMRASLDVESDTDPMIFHGGSAELLPGKFDGWPMAANELGDVFDIGTIIKMAGHNLDDPAPSKGTRRSSGLTVVIQIEYTNTHIKPWLGLRITPYSKGPTPIYTYRVFVTAAPSYRMTKTNDDPASADRKVRVFNGVRIIIEQHGKMASWDLNQFIVIFSSALGLVAVATTITEFMMTTVMAKKEYYRKKKFLKTKDLNPDDQDGDGAPGETHQKHEHVAHLLKGIEEEDNGLVYEALKQIVNDLEDKKKKAAGRETFGA